MEAMLTVRLDADVKQRGIKAMEGLGVTPSQAVRRLFDYAASHDALPFDTASCVSKEEVRKRIAAFDRCHTNAPLTMTDDELREERLRNRYEADA